MIGPLVLRRTTIVSSRRPEKCFHSSPAAEWQTFSMSLMPDWPQLSLDTRMTSSCLPAGAGLGRIGVTAAGTPPRSRPTCVVNCATVTLSAAISNWSARTCWFVSFSEVRSSRSSRSRLRT